MSHVARRLKGLTILQEESMTKYEKWQLWDRLFGWPLKWKKPWKDKHGVNYFRDIQCVIDDPDMPF